MGSGRMRRWLLALGLGSGMLVALAGGATGVAAADVCVIVNGKLIISRGSSVCTVDSGSTAIAVNGGTANASGTSPFVGSSRAIAINGSTASARLLGGNEALAVNNSTATVINDSEAKARGTDCMVTAVNGETEICDPF